MAREELSAAMKAAQPLLRKSGYDLSRLPLPVATVLAVYNAQGIIDNGGYRYFFEADWPGNPEYSLFVEAYRGIGCEAQAEDLARVVKTFPFPDPQLHAKRRNEYIDERYDPDQYHVRGWGDALCGDAAVWRSLESYFQAHKRYFALKLL